MLAPYRQKILNYTEALTGWQKFYFAATIIAVLQFISGTEDYNYELVGALALAGLAVELWPKFVEVWETLLGRVIVVFTYALVGHFVVVNARHELNSVVGVDPSSLFYATSFVSLITAPLLIIAITLVVMAFYMLAKQMWFFITFIPWVLGLYEKSGLQVAMYPKTTRVLRIAMLPFMFMFLISVLDFYGENKDASDTFVDAVVAEFTDDKDRTSEAEKSETPSEGTEQRALSNAANEVSQSADKKGEEDIEDLTVTIKGASEEVTRSNDLTMESTIAAFVYYIEAFAQSQCVTVPNERVVSLGEHDILSVIPDKTSASGYRFTVRECKLKEYGKPLSQD